MSPGDEDAGAAGCDGDGSRRLPAANVRVLDALGERDIRELGDVLVDCVEGGASVGFLWPITRATADAFWRRVAGAVARRERVVVVAEDATGTLVGTVQVVLDTPENQPHRGDVAKMLVARRARRGGLGARLLAAAERTAAERGRTLLVLDTATGSDAERLYAAHGWQRCGTIPDYALWPDGRACSTTVFYKSLARPECR